MVDKAGGPHHSHAKGGLKKEVRNTFTSYLQKLSDLALYVSWQSFVDLQKVQAELQEGYKSGTLTLREMKTLYDVSTVIMNNMRQELHQQDPTDI